MKSSLKMGVLVEGSKATTNGSGASVTSVNSWEGFPSCCLGIESTWVETVTAWVLVMVSASGPGITRMYRDIYLQDPGLYKDLDPFAIGQMTTGDIFKASNAGNPLAKKVMAQAIRFWGKASANLVSLFNPEILIFGGGVFGPATQFLQDIHQEAGKWAQPISFQKVRFVPSKLGADAGLYGAGFLSLQPRNT